MARPKASRPKEAEGVRKSPRSKSGPAFPAALPTRSKTAKISKPDGPAKRGRKKAEPSGPTQTESSQIQTARTPAEPVALFHAPAKSNGASDTPKETSEVVTEADILAADTLAKVVAFVNLLVGTQQQLFDRYKHTARLQMDADARLIAELRRELENKQTSVDALLALLQRVQDDADARRPASMASSTPQRGRAAAEMYELPIRGRNASLLQQHELAGELKTIGVTLDMLELLTGVRIISYEEDRAKFYFDVKQLSTTSDNDTDAVNVVYRLVIKRKFEQTAEVTYVPTFLHNLELADDSSDSAHADARAVAACLPEYLKDNLIFPYNTLLQFYAKMSKALNKGAKH